MNKNVVDKLTKLMKPNEKFLGKITVFICMTSFEGYGSIMREFVIAAMLNPSPKSPLMQEFSIFSRILTGLEG